MNLCVNGERVELRDDATVADLVAHLQMTDRYVAVERNRCVVPRTAWDKTPLAEGDECEIVSLVGGG